MFRTDFIYSITNAMELMFNKMIEGVVLAVEARSRALAEEGCYRVFFISARFIYIGAYPAVYIYHCSLSIYIPDYVLYYLAVQLN